VADLKVNHRKAKYKAVSGRLSDHFGFKLSDDGSVSSVENIYCMTCHKFFAYHGSNTTILYHLHLFGIEFSTSVLTKINYELIVNFQKVNYYKILIITSTIKIIINTNNNSININSLSIIPSITFKQNRFADEVGGKWTHNHQHAEEKQLLKYLPWWLLHAAQAILHKLHVILNSCHTVMWTSPESSTNISLWKTERPRPRCLGLQILTINFVINY